MGQIYSNRENRLSDRRFRLENASPGRFSIPKLQKAQKRRDYRASAPFEVKENSTQIVANLSGNVALYPYFDTTPLFETWYLSNVVLQEYR